MSRPQNSCARRAAADPKDARAMAVRDRGYQRRIADAAVGKSAAKKVRKDIETRKRAFERLAKGDSLIQTFGIDAVVARKKTGKASPHSRERTGRNIN